MHLRQYPWICQPQASTYVEITLLPFEGTQKIDPTKGGTVTTSDGASVEFPADSLEATGMVTVSLAFLDASDDTELAAFPGNFTTDKGELLESFNAVAVEV